MVEHTKIQIFQLSNELRLSTEIRFCKGSTLRIGRERIYPFISSQKSKVTEVPARCLWQLALLTKTCWIHSR